MTDMFPDYHDGEFLAPKHGAKLASLFGLCEAEPEGNECFKFTAPKQPRRGPCLGPPPQKQAPAPSVLLAVAVHAFRFVDGQYVAHGRSGVAILGNHTNTEVELKQYTVLLYGRHQKRMTSARLHRGFVLTVQPGNYAAFYDDQQQVWSLKFDLEEARVNFCTEVCVAKWNSQTCRKSLLTQDVVHGEGRPVCAGDTVEVAVSSCALQSRAVGQLFDWRCRGGEARRVSVGPAPEPDRAHTGWETGMMGMRKDGRRLIIVPPDVGGAPKGIKDGVPPPSTLVFAVEILQVQPKDAECKNPPVPARGGTVHSASAGSHRGDDRPSVEGKRSSCPKGSRESVSASSSSWSQAAASAAVGKPSAVSSCAGEGESCSPAGVQQQTSADFASFMTTESRQHGAEVRLAVARVTDKVDSLASKVDKLHEQGMCSRAVSASALETAGLLHSIQTIIQENASLKKTVLETRCKVDSAEHRCMEKFSLLLEQTDEVLQSTGPHGRLLHAEKEKVRLAEELDMSSSRVCALQQEADVLQRKVSALQAELADVLRESQRRCALITSLESKVEALETEVAQSRQQRNWRELQWTMTNLEEELEDLRAENQSLNQLLMDRQRRRQQERQRFLLELEEQRSSSQQEQQQLTEQLRRAQSRAGAHGTPRVCVIQLKSLMNKLFRRLRAQFDLREFYSGDSVLNSVLSTIKCVTLQFLKALDDEEEEGGHISAEERLSDGTEKHTTQREEVERPHSADHTYTTACEAAEPDV